MSQDTSGEKTEKATPKRMKEVRKEGGLQKSQDLSAWAGIGAGVAMMPTVFGNVSVLLQDAMAQIRITISNPDVSVLEELLRTSLWSILPAIAPMLAASVIAAIIASTIMGGINIKKLKPNFKQFNLLKGVKQKFSFQALWQGIKAVLKTAVIGLVLYSVVQQMMPILMSAGGLPLSSVLSTANSAVNRMLWTAVAAGIALSVIDIVVVARANRKKTRMSKKEVQDENKNAEGDPHVKGQRRSRQLAMSRNRMIAAVSEADVVVVNPTHVAVALKYTAGQGAPKLIAKGRGLIAQKIRDKADESNVPMVHDVPLARALHGACEVGQEVPEALFTAVAQVLAFVMLLKQRGSQSVGVHTMPRPTEVPTDMYTLDEEES